MTDALAGVRVLDFTQAWAGPTCTRMLGDFGADVIKVESETRPDIGRIVGPYRDGVRDIDACGYYVEWNRNKRSVRLNLREPEHIELAKRIAATCDVIVENFSPTVMPKLGLDYEAIRQVKPDIVFCSISGFGATGPLATAPAFGQQIEAISGLMSVTGYPGAEPMKTGVSYPDPLSGIAGVIQVMGALLERDRTGEGRWIDLSMLEITTSMLSGPLLEGALTGSSPIARGNQSDWFAPHGIYPCLGEDEWIALECHDEAEWRALVEVAGQPAWAADPRFADLAARLAHADALDEALAGFTRGEERTALGARLQAAGVPAAPVTTIADLFHDPHLRERGFWLETDHPILGKLDTAGPMANLERTPARIHVQPALLGEHHDQVVAESTPEASRA